MGFGTRKLPLRLQVARTVVYCQAAIIVITAAFLLEAELISGPATGLPLRGLFISQTVTGTGVASIALICLVAALLLIVTERQAAAHGGDARGTLAMSEVALTVGMAGFLSNSLGTWICAPGAGAAVLVVHYWPELHSYFFAAGADQTARASAAPQAMPSGPVSDTKGAPPL